MTGLKICSEQEILAATIDEIKKWKENHVIEPIYYNGQKTITTRWVLTEKFVNGKKKIKARLVARGFEEDSSEILKDMFKNIRHFLGHWKNAKK